MNIFDMIDPPQKSTDWKGDMISSQTFPQDYDFGDQTYSTIEFICGMSVPPVMIKRIVTRLIEQGVFDYAKPM